jgi:hypothetical protein
VEVVLSFAVVVQSCSGLILGQAGAGVNCGGRIIALQAAQPACPLLQFSQRAIAELLLNLGRPVGI